MSELLIAICYITYLFCALVVGRTTYKLTTGTNQSYRFDVSVVAALIWPLTVLYWAAGRVANKVANK